MTIFLLSLFGTIISAVIGTIWYSDKTPMGRIHMRYLGFDTLSKEEQKKKIEEAKPKMMKMYLAQMGLSLLTTLAVTFIVTTSLKNGLPLLLALGFVAMNWLCFMVPIIGSGILWSNCDRKIAMKKFFSDIFANLVTVLVVALIASFFA
jgi:hypothetical protein